MGNVKDIRFFQLKFFKGLLKWANCHEQSELLLETNPGFLVEPLSKGSIKESRSACRLGKNRNIKYGGRMKVWRKLTSQIRLTFILKSIQLDNVAPLTSIWPPYDKLFTRVVKSYMFCKAELVYSSKWGKWESPLSFPFFLVLLTVMS